MVQISSALLLSLAIAGANAGPIYKRIQQTIADSTAKWEQACLAAGGGLKCNPQSVTSFTTLLAAAGPCDQQNAADSMIDLAKTLSNNAEMITLTQVFAQQPRNSPNSVAIPYCQQAPKNPELNGLFQCQFQGSNQNTFVGGVAVGGPGTIPFGQSTPLTPPGGCKAHPGGPIADGTQLVDLTQNPGVGGASGSAPTPQTSAKPKKTKSATSKSTPSAAVAAVTPVSTSPAQSSSGGFKLQNGKDAQALNAKFASLTPDSACNEGDEACVDGGFAQCVSGKFVITQCAAPTKCLALPLVLKAGTSIACTTETDATSRIAATGATGGITG